MRKVSIPYFLLAVFWLSFVGFPYAKATQSPVTSSVPKTPKANYPIQKLPTAHAFLLSTVRSPGPNDLVWLDERRVMFVAALPENVVESRGIFIWDVVANTVESYSKHIRFCYADGYIVAHGVEQRRQDSELSALVPVRYGQFGKEINDVCDTKTRKGCPPPLQNNRSCKPNNYPVHARPIGPGWGVQFELKNDDGAVLHAIRSQSEGRGSPTMLLNRYFPGGLRLPFSDVPSYSVTYAEFERRYAFVPQYPADGTKSSSSNWPKGYSQPVYLVSPKGDVELISVPWRAEWDLIRRAAPSRAGLVFEGSGGYAQQWGGLFLFNGSEVVELDRGRVERWEVSPDGCRMAFAIINDYGKTRNVRFNSIKSINFCVGDK